MNKIAGTSVRIKAIAPHDISGHYILPPQAHAGKKKKKPVALKTALHEALKKTINCIKYQPLSTLLFNILCGKMVGMHKAFLL